MGKAVGGEVQARKRAKPAFQSFARPRRCWAPPRRMALLATLRQVPRSPSARLPAALQCRDGWGAAGLR